MVRVMVRVRCTYVMVRVNVKMYAGIRIISSVYLCLLTSGRDCDLSMCGGEGGRRHVWGRRLLTGMPQY